MPDRPQTLADWLRRRRSELGLTANEAASRAVPPAAPPGTRGVSRKAWWQWEAGVMRPQERMRAAIDNAMQWAPGSVEAILAGGEPAMRDNVDPKTGEKYTDVAEQALWQLRSALAQSYIRQLGAERAYELGAERAREHIRLYRLQQDMGHRVA